MSYDPINDSEAMDRFNKLQIDLANYDPKEEKIKDDKTKEPLKQQGNDNEAKRKAEKIITSAFNDM